MTLQEFKELMLQAYPQAKWTVYGDLVYEQTPAHQTRCKFTDAVTPEPAKIRMEVGYTCKFTENFFEQDSFLFNDREVKATSIKGLWQQLRPQTPQWAAPDALVGGSCLP